MKIYYGIDHHLRDITDVVLARTHEVGTTESVRDLSGDELSSKDKAKIKTKYNSIHPIGFPKVNL